MHMSSGSTALLKSQNTKNTEQLRWKTKLNVIEKRKHVCPIYNFAKAPFYVNMFG